MAEQHVRVYLTKEQQDELGALWADDHVDLDGSLDGEHVVVRIYPV